MVTCAFDYLAFENNTFDVCAPSVTSVGWAGAWTVELERRRREEESIAWLTLEEL